MQMRVMVIHRREGNDKITQRAGDTRGGPAQPRISEWKPHNKHDFTQKWFGQLKWPVLFCLKHVGRCNSTYVL